jgi:hypothetical protein
MSPNAPITGWAVTSQLETYGPDATGQAVEGVKITFRTGKGVTASVFVPKSRYTPDNARAAIAAQAAAIDAVHTMTG